MVPSLPSFVLLLPQKGEKCIQSESSKEYSEAFHYYITFTYTRMYIDTGEKHTLFPPFIISLKGSFVRKMCCELNLKIMPKCFCPVIFRFEWLFAKYSNDAFCRSPSPAKVLNVFAGASKLSAQQKHQREQVNHLALTSGNTSYILHFTSGKLHFHIR